MAPNDLDSRVRLAAFEFLTQQRRVHGDVVPRDVLAAGFMFSGTRVPLLGPQGIFKPAILPEMPISITTVPIVEGRQRPYEDEIGAEGLIRYRYRGENPDHPDNRGLRLAMLRGVPLIYFWGVVPGRYMPVWPVYIVDDDRHSLSFTVAVDDRVTFREPRDAVAESGEDARRRYVTRATQVRLHQQSFSDRVLAAYQEHCAIFRLRHRELLEAAHILPDGHPRGLPVVPNGLALCKLHHAAFDANILGIRPDYVVEIRNDVLKEHDGPMLIHGLQGFQHHPILVPRSTSLRPDRDLLEERYELFRKAG